MRRSAAFWRVLMAGSIAGWLFVLAGLAAAAAGSPLTAVPGLGTAWLACCIIWATHPLELPIALRIGAERGLKPPTVVLKTLAFGFTWWLGLKRGELEG